MKKLVILICCLSLFACKEQSTAEKLKGVWKLEAVEGENLTDSEKSTSLTFFGNGTFIQTRNDKQRTGSWKLNGNRLSINEASKGLQVLDIVEITGTELILLEPEDGERITLIKQ